MNTCSRGIVGSYVEVLYIFEAVDLNDRLIHDISHPFTRYNLIYLSGFAAIFFASLFILTNVHI